MVKYYTVGGFVRDELLGVKSKDIDFAVEASSYEEMKEDILNRGMIIFQERPEYFAIRARHPILGGADFVLCRKDGFYSDSRRPDSVEPGNIFDDLARRDFTVNAIAKDENGLYIDPHNGRYDLESRILRCVGDPYDRITEDPLRILRAIRFYIVKGFSFERNLDIYLRQGAVTGLLNTVPVERKYEELKKCFEFNSWETLRFFDSYTWLRYHCFSTNELSLIPTVNYGAVSQSVEEPVSKTG